METDASASRIGACLLQPDDSNKLRQVHFASFRFNAREQKQSITFQELLACIMALKYFHKYIAYSPVILRTDHRPLIYLFKNCYTDSQISQMLTILERYDIKIEFVPGKVNSVADFLSRSHTIAFSELNLQKLEEYADSGSFPLPQQINKPSVEQDSIQRLQVPHILQPTPLSTDIWLNQPSKYSVNTETEDYDFFHKTKLFHFQPNKM